MIYQFCIPTHLFYGEGSCRMAAGEIRKRGFQSTLLITDKGLVATGVLDPIRNSFEEAHLKIQVFDEVVANPPESVIHRALEVYKQEGCDNILSVGGGSSMDAGKAVGALLSNPGSLRDYEGADKLKHPPKRIFAIPTTAGTGSEVTGSAVVTLLDVHKKISIRSTGMIPEAAFLDPLLLAHLPFDIAASTGLDALSHAIEAYTTTLSTDFTDALAVSAIRLISENIRPFCANPKNPDAALKMLIASNQAAQSFVWARVATAHSMSIPLGGRFNLPHGLATAIVLPHTMRFSLLGNVRKFAHIASLLGEDTSRTPQGLSARRAPELVTELMKELEIPLTLSELGVKEEAIDAVVEDAMVGNIHAFNCRIVGRNDLKRLFMEAL